MRNREYRRYQRDKKKLKIKKMLLNNWGWNPIDVTDTIIGLMAATPKGCSSYCCGNPRKWFKEPTVQERRVMEAC